MARKPAVYTEFDRRYDLLFVQPESTAEFANDTLTREELAVLLGRMTSNYVRSLTLARIPIPEHAMVAVEQDMSEMASYYSGSRQVNWKEAGEIADSWLFDFANYPETSVSSPTLSEPSA